MKTQLKRGTTFFGIIAMAFLFTACTDEPVEPTPPGGPGQPGNSNIIDQNIDTYTVLTNHSTGVDYEICGSISVLAELIIEPGVEIVMCAGAQVSVEPNGSLNAVGTIESPITFRGKAATPGFWGLLHFNSNNPSNELDHVIVTDAGGSNYFQNASIWLNNNSSAQLTVKNSLIKNGKGTGILVEDGSSIPNFSKNTFTNNNGAPIKIPISIIGSIDDSSNYADGNVENYVHVVQASVNQPQEVKNINVPYFIDGTSDINSDLKLNPGVEMLMGAVAQFNVQPSGSFNAIGTDVNPITIKGKVNSVGYWGVIHVNSNNPLNKFSYVNLQNGGSSSYYTNSTIWINNNNTGSFNMTDCSISDSYSWALYVESGTIMFPSTAPAVESANSFSNNGTGTNANCTGSCNVFFY